MTKNKKSPSKVMKDYQNEKLEIAEEIGAGDPNCAEVDVKLASQNEAKYSKKTTAKHNFLNNPDKQSKGK